MGISEREHHIKVLENLLKETKGRIELYSENKNIDLTKEKEIVEALGYAISSLKIDEAYQIMYEGGEIYTKADIVAMLTEIQLEIEKLNMHGSIQLQSYRQKTGRYRQGFERAQYLSTKVIQQKINALKGE